MKFKTNINCQNCVASVKNVLNEIVGTEQWEVDTTVEDKILSIKNEDIDVSLLQNKLKRIGFSAEEIVG
jgi:copper chaperone